MAAENIGFLQWLAALFGPAGFVLAVVCMALAWWIWKTHGWHRDEREAWEKKSASERETLAKMHSMESEAWLKRIDGFRQDIKDAFVNVSGVSKDMAEALGRVVDVVTDLRVTVASKH